MIVLATAAFCAPLRFSADDFLLCSSEESVHHLHSEMPQCVCYEKTHDGDAYVEWIYNTFSDCVYTPQQIAAFFIGCVPATVALLHCFIALYLPLLPTLPQDVVTRLLDMLSDATVL